MTIEVAARIYSKAFANGADLAGGAHAVAIEQHRRDREALVRERAAGRAEGLRAARAAIEALVVGQSSVRQRVKTEAIAAIEALATKEPAR